MCSREMSVHLACLAFAASLALAGCGERALMLTSADSGLVRPGAASACCLASRSSDDSDQGPSALAGGCPCKKDAGDTCQCAFQGSSCGEGAKTCKATACRAHDCTCKALVCPTMEQRQSPGECRGNAKVGGGDDHCLPPK